MEDDDKYTRITLRIPKDVHKRLGEEADRTSKSLNAEIIARLQLSFSDLGTIAQDNAYRLLAEAQASTIHLLGYSLMTATTKKTGDSKAVADLKASLRNIAICLHNKDLRGAAVEASELASVNQSIQELESLEDLGMVRKPIVLAKASASDKPKRAERPANKVLMTGNLDIETELNRYLPTNPPQNNKGPVRRVRNKPPK